MTAPGKPQSSNALASTGGYGPSGATSVQSRIQFINVLVSRMCLNSLDFRRGDASPHLVFLGACPGQEEFVADPQRPFAGQSGQNLRSLLEVLRNRATAGEYGLLRDDFQSNNPDDYTLMNSYAAAKWLAQDGRSTPQMSEVETRENLQRLRNQFQLVNARVVIGLGRPVDNARLRQRGKDSAAMRAIRCLASDNPQITFLVSGHPSPRAINRFGGGNALDWFDQTLSTFPIENPQD